MIVNQAFFYSDTTTHPYLVEEMVKLYNNYYDSDLTPEQVEWMKQGSTNEDIWPRNWYHHFYDPVHNRGFGGFSAKDWAQNPSAQAEVSGGDHSWQTAIKDYNAGYKKRAFISLGHILHLIEDMAVPAHTREDPHHNGGDPLENWAGDLPGNSVFYNIATPLIGKGIKPKIFNNLNAYFDEVANFSNRNFFSNDSIKENIDEFGRIRPDAKYPEPKIVKEVFYTRTEGHAYGKVDGYSKLIKLAKVEKDGVGNKSYYIRKEYPRIEDSPEIHAEYFPLLAKEAVINGAGVVKLFFDSIVEPATEIVEPVQQLSFWQKFGNGIMGGVKFVVSVFNGLVSVPPSAIESVVEESMPESEYMGTIGTFAPKIVEGVVESNEDSGSLTPKAESPNIDSTGGDEAINEEEIFIVKKVIDGDSIVLESGQEVRYIGINAPELPNGCFAQEATNKNKELVEGKQVRLEKDVSETDIYGRLLRYVYLDSLFINDYLVRNGYAYDFAYAPDIKLQEQFAKAEEKAKESRQGLWGDICHPIVVQGQTTGGDGGISGKLIEEMQTAAQNQSQQNSQEQSPSVSDEASADNPEGEQPEQDTTPPDVFLSPLVFNHASSSMILQWSSQTPSVSFDVEYKIGDSEWQGLLENTTETQTIFSAENQDIAYYFRVRAKDLLGNSSEWQESSIEIISKPIVINEIAWMGTKGSPQDEWIELFNRANYDIDLNGWVLKSDDNSPEIIFVEGDEKNKTTVNSVISAKGYYLLERISENDEPDDVTSVPADWFGSFSYGLKDSGEALELRDNANNLIDSVDKWYAGDNEGKKTMERINPDRPGTEPKNWKTYVGTGSQTTDSKGNSIFGTPKAQNSVYKLYTAVDKNIIEDTIWTFKNSPYLVYDNSGSSYELLEISEGATLTIEPGVIVKFINPGLKVFGTIKANGTTDKPIVFTDYNDKKYAGEIFGSIASPQAGAWSGIWFLESSTDSVLDNIIIRYAGSRTRPFRTGATYSDAAVGAGIRVDNTSIILRNSTIEHNLFAGVLLTNSPNTVIENSTFQNHLEHDNSYTTLAGPTELRNIALYIDSSNPRVEDSAFQNNLTGIYIVNNSQPASLVGGPIIENNNFFNNSRPIWVQSSYPEFSNNQIEGNQWDGIVVKGLKLNRDYTLGGGPASPAGGSVFINYDEIPFWSIVVPEGIILTIEPGTIIKSVYSTSGLIIEGTLIAEGTSEEPIVFTSFYDDEYGGDTNGDGDKAEYCRTKDPDDNTYPNCPRAGFWGQIVFTPTSTDSSLNYVIIRYGGKKWGQSYNYQPDYVLKVENTDLAIANSRFENNTSGLYLENSSSQITNSTFCDHQWSQPFSYFISTGIWLVSSNPTIDISTFSNNKLGIYIDPASLPTLLNLVFSDNDKDIEDLRVGENP